MFQYYVTYNGTAFESEFRLGLIFFMWSDSAIRNVFSVLCWPMIEKSW